MTDCQHKFTRTETETDITDKCDLCGFEASMKKQAEQPLTPEKRGAVVVRAGHEIAALVPTTIQEAWLFCNKMASSFNLPKAFYEMPKLPEGVDKKTINIMDVATARAMHALQLGMEVGLPPAQAIQSVLVQNGVGTLWGDAQLGLVLSSGKAEYVREYTEGGSMWLDVDKTQPNPEYTWICETLRRGHSSPTYGKFSIADAIRAALWDKRGKAYDNQPGKPSTWITHPERMGKYKARAFALRDTYADVLKGLTHSREEMEGEPIDITPASDITPQAPAEALTKILETKTGG